MQGLFQCGGAFHYPMVSFKTLSPNKDRFECSSWTASEKSKWLFCKFSIKYFLIQLGCICQFVGKLFSFMSFHRKAHRCARTGTQMCMRRHSYTPFRRLWCPRKQNTWDAFQMQRGWMEPEQRDLYLDLCLEEITTGRTSFGSQVCLLLYNISQQFSPLWLYFLLCLKSLKT